MGISQLQTYSIGIAAENKPLTSRTLNVTPIEQLPAIDGELTFNPEEQISTGTDTLGNQYEVKVTSDTSLTAEWLPMGSNRVTPPDIRRGEYVEILRLGDSDRFYWRPMGLRDDLRRLETVIYAFNANPKESSNGVDVNNCYYIEISTHNKLVTFSTSNKNGEPYRYTMQLNTSKGEFTFTDDINNFVEIISKERTLRAKNTDTSYIEIDKDTITAKNQTTSYLNIDGDRITAKNKTGSNIEVVGDKITATNKSGSLVDINAGKITAKEMTGATITMEGQAIQAVAATSISLTSGGSSITVTPAGISMIAPGCALMMASAGLSMSGGGGGMSMTAGSTQMSSGSTSVQLSPAGLSAVAASYNFNN